MPVFEFEFFCNFQYFRRGSHFRFTTRQWLTEPVGNDDGVKATRWRGDGNDRRYRNKRRRTLRRTCRGCCLIPPLSLSLYLYVLLFALVCLFLLCLRSCLRCGTRQCAIRKPRCGSRRSGVARNPYKKHSFAAGSEATRSRHCWVTAAEAFCMCSLPFPFPFFVFFLSELARCHLPSCRCLLPLPFWVSIQLQLSSLNCGAHRKNTEKRKKRGNSLGCQVPIVGFTFGPDKLKCPRTIPGVDFLFMCPLALSRSPLSSAYLAVFLSVFTVFFFLSLFLPPVLRSCSASGKPLNWL